MSVPKKKSEKSGASNEEISNVAEEKLIFSEGFLTQIFLIHFITQIFPNTFIRGYFLHQILKAKSSCKKIVKKL